MNQQCWNDLLVKVISSDTAAEAVSRGASLLQCTDTVPVVRPRDWLMCTGTTGASLVSSLV